MENENKQLKIWRAVAVIALFALVAVSVVSVSNITKPVQTQTASVSSQAVVSSSQASETKSAPCRDALKSWTDSARSKEEFVKYMESITDPSSADFIPVEDRIAVFDLDGTLCCETDPGYFDHMLYYYRVMEDPDYKDKATEEDKKTAAKCKEYFESRNYPSGLDYEHGQGVANVFKGMSLEEFYKYVKAFRDTPANGYEGMTKGEAFYQPMVEIVNCLQANDFQVYIVSGTDRFIVRGLLIDGGKLDIPFTHIIGSDENLVASNQNGKDPFDYMFSDQDKLILGGDFIIKNLKMNKVTVIAKEIGKQPVLSFGNSSGDNSMAEYTVSNNKYKSLAFMLCCDDLVRENGKEDAAKKMEESCQKYGWIPISMKNDWTTIYGEGVKRKAS